MVYFLKSLGLDIEFFSFIRYWKKLRLLQNRFFGLYIKYTDEANQSHGHGAPCARVGQEIWPATREIKTEAICSNGQKSVHKGFRHLLQPRVLILWENKIPRLTELVTKAQTLEWVRGAVSACFVCVRVRAYVSVYMCVYACACVCV